MKKNIFFGIFGLLLLSVFAACSDSGTDESPNPADKPVITISQPGEIPATGGAGRIELSIANPVEGASVTATAVQEPEWFRILSASETEISYEAGVNVGDTPRSVTVKVEYANADAQEVVLTQASPSVQRTLAFEISILEITSRSVRLNCVPSDPEASYIGTVIDKEDFDRYSDDDAYIEYYITYLQYVEEQYGYSVQQMLRHGSMINYDIALPSPEKEYYFIAFGFTADCIMTSPCIYKELFRTTSPETTECTFDFSVRRGIEYTRVAVLPSNNQTSYLWGVMAETDFEALGDDPGAAIMQQIRDEVEKRQNSGEEAHFAEYTVYSSRSCSYDDLEEGTSYVAYAFGCDISGKGSPTTELARTVFVERREPAVDCSFTLSFSSVRATSFVADIVPSDPTVRWFAYTLPQEVRDKYPSVEAMSEDVIDILTGLGIQWAEDTDYIHTGSQTLSSREILGDELTPETAQIVVVFGITDEGVRNTKAMHSVVTTSQLGVPSKMTIGIEGETWGYSGAKVSFTPSVREVYFYDLIPKEYYEDEAFTSDLHFMEYLVSDYVAIGLLPYKLTIGPASMETEALMPGTEYLGVAFGYDSEVSTGLFSWGFKTGSVPMGGTASITDIAVKIEDGDRYYASDPLNYYDCRGMAVVSITPQPDASAQRYYMGVFSDLASLTEQEITDLLVGHGDSVPCSYILDWDTAFEIAVLAFDADGKAGPILRKGITPLRSDIETFAVRSSKNLRKPGLRSQPRARFAMPENYVLLPEAGIPAAASDLRLGNFAPTDSPRSEVFRPATNPESAELHRLRDRVR